LSTNFSLSGWERVRVKFVDRYFGFSILSAILGGILKAEGLGDGRSGKSHPCKTTPKQSLSVPH
jgi:hypothetical protein